MPENKFLDDIAKFGTNTLSAFSGMQRQVKVWVGEQLDTLIKSMDLVNKDELEVYKKVAEDAANRVAELENRIKEIEANAVTPKPAAAASTSKAAPAKAKKPATKSKNEAA